MRELNAITSSQYEEALASEPEVKNRRPILMENYATDMVAAQMTKLVGQEESSSEGYRIYTTIDLGLQRQAEASLKKQLEAVEHRPEFKTRQSFETFDALYRTWRKQRLLFSIITRARSARLSAGAMPVTASSTA
jgi:membrane carboxypeptidase/penicillin-binding protein